MTEEMISKIQEKIIALKAYRQNCLLDLDSQEGREFHKEIIREALKSLPQVT